mmetsp:Transcript_85142/g.177933  ORF Transcript_85142/g.177933 Transcript_85142/m.177933 type:complete len:119 (+) Transcript_85142:290-646(+)
MFNAKTSARNWRSQQQAEKKKKKMRNKRNDDEDLQQVESDDKSVGLPPRPTAATTTMCRRPIRSDQRGGHFHTGGGRAMADVATLTWRIFEIEKAKRKAKSDLFKCRQNPGVRRSRQI